MSASSAVAFVEIATIAFVACVILNFAITHWRQIAVAGVVIALIATGKLPKTLDEVAQLTKHNWPVASDAMLWLRERIAHVVHTLVPPAT